MAKFKTNKIKTSDRFELYYKNIICLDLLLKENYTTITQIPVLEKITINATSNSYAIDKKNIIPTLLCLEMITGQKPKLTLVRKSLALFKIREKQIIGCKVTLRRDFMYNFLNLLITVVLPRLREFSGISSQYLGKSKEISLGLSNVLVFPQLENHFEYFQSSRGFNINFSGLRSHQPHLLYTAFQLPK